MVGGAGGGGIGGYRGAGYGVCRGAGGVRGGQENWDVGEGGDLLQSVARETVA